MQTTEILTRAAAFEPSSFNAEQNSVEAVFSAGPDVTRYDGQGQFIERLDMTPQAVDLSRLMGAPVLKDHDRFSVDSILVTVEHASVDGTRRGARIKFGQM